MPIVHRVLYPHPIADLDEYVRTGGGSGLEAAKGVEPVAVIEELTASGLRGRGGAGFPTGVKWRTVFENHAPTEPSTVVVNGAEGEPGTFKDRTILRINPYAVVEGALIAARTVGADAVIFGLKRSFGPEVARVRRAVAEMEEAGWTDGIRVEVFEGPNEYLYGEETALLETIDGRYPFPRVTPPYRRGVDEVVETAADATADSSLSAHVEMAGGDTDAPPTLVDNVETLANVPRIIARGADWFRTEGTDKSPGTIVCTVTGQTKRSGVVEVPMGTPLSEVIELAGGGPRSGRTLKAVLPGVSNGYIPAAQFDTPLSYEDMAAIGSGLGSAGFIVLDDTSDIVSVTAGVSRFLAVESCGQCSPCKQDGLVLSELLAKLASSNASHDDINEITNRMGTVAERSRCYLANQHQVIVQSLLDRFPDEVTAHVERRMPAVTPDVVAELVDIEGETAVIDTRHADKQPDWTFHATYSGQWPAERLDEHRRPEVLED